MCSRFPTMWRSLSYTPLAMETLGLTLAEGKALLANVQTYVVTQQAAAYLEQERPCAMCKNPHLSKEQRRSPVHAVFGPVAVPNPRWHCCACQETGPQTFRPTARWLTGHTNPELLYYGDQMGLAHPLRQGCRLIVRMCCR